jgi:hypothetical protein
MPARLDALIDVLVQRRESPAHGRLFGCWTEARGPDGGLQVHQQATPLCPAVTSARHRPPAAAAGAGSWAEHDAVVAAWRAAGVIEVVDKLSVTG